MSIESNNHSSPVEFKPYLVGDVTPDEIRVREQLFAPNVDYTALSAGIEALPTEAPHPTIEIPKLEDVEAHDPAPLPKRFSNNLLPANEIPQLEDEDDSINPAASQDNVVSNLLPADQIPQLEPDRAPREPRHRL